MDPDLRPRSALASDESPNIPPHVGRNAPSMCRTGRGAVHSHRSVAQILSGDNHPSNLDDPVIGAVAAAVGMPRAQVMLLCGLQQGRSVIPKFTKPTRMAENIDVFDFELSAGEIPAIDGLETGRRCGPEPEATTLDPSVA